MERIISINYSTAPSEWGGCTGSALPQSLIRQTWPWPEDAKSDRRLRSMLGTWPLERTLASWASEPTSHKV